MVLFLSILLFIMAIIMAVVLVTSAMYTATSDPPKRCSKDSSKICPYSVTISSNGGMKASGHLGCCKVIDQIKSLNRMIANAKPGKTYGEFTFSKEVIEQAKKDEASIQKIDSN